jgi:hypothetical protein
MTAPPSHVQVVPDLALVACPPDPEPWNREFYDLYSQVFLKHDEKVREYEFVWALSDELLLCLLGNEFPWNAVGEIGWVTELMVAFEEWRRTIKPLPVEHYPGVLVEPDITPNYVGGETKQAWLDVLAGCVQSETALSYIASFPQRLVVRLRVCLGQSASEYMMKLIRQVAEWDAVLAQVDPWFRHSLPRVGNCPYEPPRFWHWGQPFPKGEGGIGFLDAKGRTWIWDREEKHWDVQDRHPGRGRYIRVTSEGRRLE